MLRVCEGKTMSIKCKAGTVINVLSASYGRKHGKEVCPSSAIQTQDCHAVSSLPKVKSFCQGKNSCSVQSTNTHFGDPCGGTHKYLTVNYACKKQAVCKPGYKLDSKNKCVGTCNGLWLGNVILTKFVPRGVVTVRVRGVLLGEPFTPFIAVKLNPNVFACTDTYIPTYLSTCLH